MSSGNIAQRFLNYFVQVDLCKMPKAVPGVGLAQMAYGFGLMKMAYGALL